MKYYEETANRKAKPYKIAAIIFLVIHLVATSNLFYRWFQLAQSYLEEYNRGLYSYARIEIDSNSFTLFVIINILLHVLIGSGLHFVIENYREKVLQRLIQTDLLHSVNFLMKSVSNPDL